MFDLRAGREFSRGRRSQVTGHACGRDVLLTPIVMRLLVSDKNLDNMFACLDWTVIQIAATSWLAESFRKNTANETCILVLKDGAHRTDRNHCIF